MSGKGQVVGGQGTIGGEGEDRREVSGESELNKQRGRLNRKEAVNISRLVYMAEW